MTTTTKLNEAAARVRAQRHAQAHGLLVIRRTSSALGPVLVIDERRGKVIHSNVPNFRTLCTRLGLQGRTEGA